MTTAVSDTTAHTKLDTINSSLGNTLTTTDTTNHTKLDTVNSKLDTVNTNLGTLEDDVETTNTTLTTTNTKLDTVNTNLGTIETDIETIHTKLDTLETTLTNIETNTPKTLRQYRAEGKCYCAYSNMGLAANNSTAYLNNPTGSGKVYYVYNISVSSYYHNSTADRSVYRLGFVDGEYSSGATLTFDVLNLKLYNDSVRNSASLVGFGSSISFTGSFNYAQYISMVGMGTSMILDYQEEFIEIPEGKCIFIRVADQADPIYAQVSWRWIEVDA